MNKIKSFIKRLFLPSGVTIGFLIPFSFAGIFYLIAADAAILEKTAVALLCTYTLTVISIRIPTAVDFLKSVQKNNAFVHKFTTDPFMRVKFSLPASIVFDLIYIVIQCIIGLVNQSFWFYVLAGYYVALVVMRLFLLKEFSPQTTTAKSSLQVRLFIGISLIFLNLALGAMVFYIVKYGRGFTTGWLFSLAMLSYTIGALITATVGVIKYRKLKSPALTASKVINFTAAAVSVLVLETVLIDTFGGSESYAFRRQVTEITGISVCAFVLILSVFLVLTPARAKIHKRRRLKKAKEQKEHSLPKT